MLWGPTSLHLRPKKSGFGGQLREETGMRLSKLKNDHFTCYSSLKIDNLKTRTSVYLQLSNNKLRRINPIFFILLYYFS